ncbi:hypothetical protein SteCoe_15866 [Stentor coeruleus]|uniref:Uncharacterized protein n=1 Tax=Stentor coeruleus TaxID=5963 RepID=A0A1R2C2P6_9CILI|nr:hypothetical protein SteCoe_15866 [Stentor coeruleus]
MSCKNNQKSSKVLISLNKACDKILEDLKKLKLTMPTTESLKKVQTISEKFNTLKQNWSNLASRTLSTINITKTQANQYIRSMEINRNILQEVQKDKKRIKSQEIILRKNEVRLGRSLGEIKNLWEVNLIEMESSLKSQKETLNKITKGFIEDCLSSKNFFPKTKDFKQDKKLIIETHNIPNLHLEHIQKKTTSTSRHTSEKSSKYYNILDENIQSNRGSFSFITEDIASFRSYSYKTRTGNKNNLKDQSEKIRQPTQEILSPINFAQIIQENENNGEKSKVSNQSISSKSRSRLKNALLNDSVNIDEIKEALVILKRANLINKNGNKELLKLAEMMKNPENSSNVELMLQLIEIEGQKSSKSNPKQFKFAKPHTPSNKKRLRISKISDIEGTSREKFRFLEDKSFNRTILSNENFLSPKNYDECMENSQKEGELKDVKLEDLLNVASIMDDLGLASADNSVIQKILSDPLEESTEKKLACVFGDDCDELPVKFSSNISRISRISNL